MTDFTNANIFESKDNPLGGLLIKLRKGEIKTDDLLYGVACWGVNNLKEYKILKEPPASKLLNKFKQMSDVERESLSEDDIKQLTAEKNTKVQREKKNKANYLFLLRCYHTLIKINPKSNKVERMLNDLVAVMRPYKTQGIQVQSGLETQEKYELD